MEKTVFKKLILIIILIAAAFFSSCTTMTAGADSWISDEEKPLPVEGEKLKPIQQKL